MRGGEISVVSLRLLAQSLNLVNIAFKTCGLIVHGCWKHLEYSEILLRIYEIAFSPYVLSVDKKRDHVRPTDVFY